MKRKFRSSPTRSQLQILRALWENGPSTVKKVQDVLGIKRFGYTTVLKQLQLMAAKGIVTRDESDRAHVYSASALPEKTKRQMVGDLLDQVFEGKASDLVLHALSGQKASREEIEEVRRMLDEYERTLE